MMDIMTRSVVWITGNSSAGKTTVARHLHNLIAESGVNCIFLDGDDLRSILSRRWGYTQGDRLELAKTYIQLASHISSQGNVVIISAVAMFNEIYAWFKTNVENPVLIYLDVPLEERLSRDEGTKGVYKKLKSQEVQYDIPSAPDLSIKNFGDITPEISAQLIRDHMKKFVQNAPSDKGRTEHWNEFYLNGDIPQFPSPFAEWVSQSLTEKSKIIDIGCGNGRDSFYFNSIGHSVVGIDVSKSAIKANNKKIATKGISFNWNDLSGYMQTQGDNVADVIYARFSIHAMTEEEETETLFAAASLLKKDGFFYIETRSIKDPQARKGELISHSERIDGHYRRFGDSAILSKKLKHSGFALEYLEEKNGLAIYKDEDPIVIRIKAKKV